MRVRGTDDAGMHGSFPISILYMSEHLQMTPTYIGAYFGACVISMAVTSSSASRSLCSAGPGHPPAAVCQLTKTRVVLVLMMTY
eukprot:COSAG01_NODE_1511_length_10068_cov_7.643731_7_plen_84_part_00